MKVEKIYLIKEGEWCKWNEALYEAIDDFYGVYAIYPNILEANEHTLSQFDFLTNVRADERRRVARIDDITGLKMSPDDTEEIGLGSFEYGDADIDFAIDNQLANKEFRLIYDDEPEGDKSEMPVYCPENEYELV